MTESPVNGARSLSGRSLVSINLLSTIMQAFPTTFSSSRMFPGQG